MSFTSSWKGTLSMFALACMSAIVVGPMAVIIGVMQLNSFPGRFLQDVHSPATEFRVSDAGQTISVWGYGEDLRRDEVTCLDHGDEEPLSERTATATVDGRSFTLLLDGDYTVLNRLSCSGGGVEELRVSTRPPQSRATAFVVGGAAATIVLVPVGIALRRSVTRGDREEAAGGPSA